MIPSPGKLFCLFLALASPVFADGQAAQAKVDPINFDWRFAKGDHASAKDSSFDDSSWSRVDLPHDWAISEPFDPNGHADTAKLPWLGEGWYRKHFTLPAEAAGKRLQFIFDGVMASPKIYLNGREVGSWTYGYNSFWIDATEAANFGGENVLAVHADTRVHQSRWYPGAGIYRKVTMRLVDPVHIPVWGVYVTTPAVSDAEASVRVEVEIANQSGGSLPVDVVAEIIDPDGKIVATQSKSLTADVGSASLPFVFQVAKPQRWDIDHPHLYVTRTRVSLRGREVDAKDTTFGIRTIKWTANDGFQLNGRRVDLKGVCEHHTHGMLGAAFYPRAMERKLEILKDMGINALRTSHNAEAPEVLEICDRLGIVVINELFDKWDGTAGVRVKPAEYVEHHAESEVQNFVRRDRNHPSAVIWSISNEDWAVLANSDGKSSQHVARVVDFFRKHDPSRPTVIVSPLPDSANRDKHIFDAVDAGGWNYGRTYANFRKNYPDKPIIYTETASAFGTRGYYALKTPASKTDYGPGPYQNNYGLTAAPWSDIPEYEFERMRKDPFVCGLFVWTGFDYLGEPTPARGQGAPELTDSAHTSFFGIIDLAGLPKDAFYLYRSQWRKDAHTVHLTPHWNWSTGDRVPVIVYTDGDEAELFLNSRSLGRKTKLDPDKIEAANFAFGRNVQATSSETIRDEGGNVFADRSADKAVDGNPETRWCAATGNYPQELQVDLGRERAFSRVTIHWENNGSDYQFELLASPDGTRWETISGQVAHVGSLTTITLPTTQARHLKVRVTGSNQGRWASIRELGVYDSDVRAQDPYFDIVDAYRLRFLDVPYEPGELKTVAYKNGKKIGESVVRTAAEPAALELKADRTQLAADGMDLCYVTVRMLDAKGNLCPLAMNRLRFETQGAALFMGVANGDQMGLDTLTDETHPLFYGQAVAVLRSKPGASGPAVLTITDNNGISAKIPVNFESPQR
jgi:beta-galactosidase/beta-glucuronidase